MRFDDADRVSAGLTLHVYDNRGRLIHPGCKIAVLYAIHYFCDVSQHHRRAVAVGDDDLSDSPCW